MKLDYKFTLVQRTFSIPLSSQNDSGRLQVLSIEMILHVYAFRDFVTAAALKKQFEISKFLNLPTSYAQISHPDKNVFDLYKKLVSKTMSQ
uniref:Uncharacterized protein n=1 Tax=Ascaris lumbricoides TaxID=6252 RepID=A0A0M3HSN7_ASCLU